MPTELIKSIEEVENYQDEECSWSGWDGFKVTTNQQEILLLIDNCQSCCEVWGYFLSEDDIDKFVGASLRDVTITDTALNTKRVENEASYLDEGDTLFVNLDTSRGKLQFVAYNGHNGYYGHEAKVISKQLTASKGL
jgi:hypothetical protein